MYINAFNAYIDLYAYKCIYYIYTIHCLCCDISNKMHLLITKISARKGVNLMTAAVSNHNQARYLCLWLPFSAPIALVGLWVTWRPGQVCWLPPGPHAVRKGTRVLNGPGGALPRCVRWAERIALDCLTFAHRSFSSVPCRAIAPAGDPTGQVRKNMHSYSKYAFYANLHQISNICYIYTYIVYNCI